MTEPEQYPRETVEAVPVTVRRNGTAVTTGVEFAVARYPGRPATWAPAVDLTGGGTAVRIAGLEPGTWEVFARVQEGGGYAPVVECGTLEVT